jgi:ABC-type polysaccharide/polyol phosphate transport system ATPase subunit
VTRPWRRAPLARFNALDDVTFAVPRGAFFGIVGPNGSGKSTLTQILSGITVPTDGEAQVWGRILPLLEVGAGFHDELTGRENVYLLGAIMGLTRVQIDSALAGIVAFSGVEQHIDTAMKRYSTGMRARLSFAAAMGFPADIYVFDEVLAVVDDDFREQCSAELARLHAAGRTIIFMSHNLDLVVEMCDLGVWLERGKVRHTGSIEEVAHAYRSSSGHAVPSGSAAP